MGSPLPYASLIDDAPMICPFFTRIDPLAPTVYYYTFNATHNTSLEEQITIDIGKANFFGKRPILDYVLLFLWKNSNTLEDAKVFKNWPFCH